MRIGHLQALINLHPGKGDASSFKRFADQARVHLFDLSRLGGDYLGNIIEKLCGKLPREDRKEWARGKVGEIETRSVNEFGDWLCYTAASIRDFRRAE